MVLGGLQNQITVILHEPRMLNIIGVEKQEFSKISQSESITQIIQLLKSDEGEQFSVAWAQRKLRAGYNSTVWSEIK